MTASMKFSGFFAFAFFLCLIACANGETGTGADMEGRGAPLSCEAPTSPAQMLFISRYGSRSSSDFLACPMTNEGMVEVGNPDIVSIMKWRLTGDSPFGREYHLSHYYPLTPGREPEQKESILSKTIFTTRSETVILEDEHFWTGLVPPRFVCDSRSDLRPYLRITLLKDKEKIGGRKFLRVVMEKKDFRGSGSRRFFGAALIYGVGDFIIPMPQPGESSTLLVGAEGYEIVRSLILAAHETGLSVSGQDESQSVVIHQDESAGDVEVQLIPLKRDLSHRRHELFQKEAVTLFPFFGEDNGSVVTGH